MSIIRVHDKEFGPYLEKEVIDEQIRVIAEAIDRDYADKKPLFIAILNGAFMFASDLFKKITIEAEISFIKLASYKGTKSSGHVITAIGLIAGFYFPVSLLPDWIRWTSNVQPFTPSVDLIRHCLAGHAE